MTDTLHPTLERAAAGTLPDWAVVTPERRHHVERVSALMARWAKQLELDPTDVKRWAAAGLLHDALRDEDPELLRKELPGDMGSVHPSLLHGPAAAARLRKEGVDDEPLLLAVAHHTLGHPDWDRMGMSLCAADFLEPGRTRLHKLRKKLRKQMPAKHKKVIRRILKLRINAHLVANRALSAETVGLWNRLANG